MVKKGSLYIKIGMVLICCVSMVIALACVPKAAKERPANLTVLPTSAPASAVIIINGYQFLPNEEVEIIMTVGDVHHSLGTEKTDIVMANGQGSFEVRSGIPIKTPPGTYKITAYGNKGSVGAFNITVIK